MTRVKAPTEGTYEARAQARWKGKAPTEVLKLAQALDAEIAIGGNQGTLGSRLGLDASAVSGLIGNTHPQGRARDLKLSRIRGALMAETVVCPVEGEIGRDVCASNQQLKPSTCNPTRMALARACPTCPNAIRKETNR